MVKKSEATEEVMKGVGEVEKALQKVNVHDDSTYLDLMDSSRFEHLQRVAKVFAASKLVPQHFQGNLADCTIACQMAMRLNIDPMMLMQNTYLVHGRPGMEGKLMIALMNSRGPFRGPVQFRYEGEGESRSCTAYAEHSKTGELCQATVTWEMVKAEGWNKDKVKDGKTTKSKWNTLTDQMFAYRSATFLGRLYCPEVLMGLKTADELADLGDVIDVTPEAPWAMPKSVKEAKDEPRGGLEGQKADLGPEETAENAPEGDQGEGDFSLSPDPDEAEQAEILKQERGGYGPL